MRICGDNGQNSCALVAIVLIRCNGKLKDARRLEANLGENIEQKYRVDRLSIFLGKLLMACAERELEVKGITSCIFPLLALESTTTLSTLLNFI